MSPEVGEPQSGASADAAADDVEVPYRLSHQGRGKARRYDGDFWRAGTAKFQDWMLERALLDEVFATQLPAPPKTALDFACGSGRVLSELETRVPSTTGVDISADMLELAAERCQRSTLVCADVTADSGAVAGGPFDLITSFRFLLNAEPSLRLDALHWMRSKLSPQGRLVANFHLNPYSLRGTYLRARWAGERRTPMLSAGEISRLMWTVGLTVESIRGYEYLPYRRQGSTLLAPRARAGVERALLHVPGIRAVAACHLVVARAG